MKPALIQREIQALGRGELEVGTFIGRVRDILVESEHSAADLLAELEDAHRQEAITTSDYTRLAAFISEGESDADK